jgi:hypothetical protein
MYGGDEVSAIVMDVGTNSVKAGYAGHDTPTAVFSSVRIQFYVFTYTFYRHVIVLSLRSSSSSAAALMRLLHVSIISASCFCCLSLFISLY